MAKIWTWHEKFYYKQGYPPVDKKFNNIPVNRCLTNNKEKQLLQSFIQKYPIKKQTLENHIKIYKLL